MRQLKSVLVLCLLILFSCMAIVEAVDLSGTWESKYQFGPEVEVMNANIQQVGNNLLGSFSVQPSSGDKYSGIIFGTVEGDMAKVYWLSQRRTGKPETSISFADCLIPDKNTLKGTFYYQDTDMNALSAPFEAIRK